MCQNDNASQLGRLLPGTRAASTRSQSRAASCTVPQVVPCAQIARLYRVWPRRHNQIMQSCSHCISTLALAIVSKARLCNVNSEAPLSQHLYRSHAASLIGPASMTRSSSPQRHPSHCHPPQTFWPLADTSNLDLAKLPMLNYIYCLS